MNNKLSFILAIFFCAYNVYGQFPASCDPQSARSCVGNALTLTVPNGKGAHYVDVGGYRIKDKTQTMMTFEAWIKPERQAGKIQFIAGLWGPASDNNDVWRLYFDQNDNLVFEINGDGTKLVAIDNTIAQIPAATLYGSWNHITAQFDGNTGNAFLYINGILQTTARNSSYPAQYLRPPENQSLPLQIGSTNGLSDNENLFRTFKGQMDEIRYWNRIIPQPELECERYKSRAGNEPGLIFYYRCNENNTTFTLCDATGKNYTGNMRSGARCDKSDRDYPLTITTSVDKIDEEVRCDDKRSWNITIQDTSICGNNVSIRIVGRDNSSFSLSRGSAQLLPKNPVTFTVNFSSVIVGNIIADLKIRSTNACGKEITIPIRLTRTTELNTNRQRINYDTLFAGCINQLYKDTVIKICNSSDKIGTPRTVTISAFQTDSVQRFFIVNTPLPLLIPPGDCKDVTIRFYSVGSPAGDYRDTVKVVSDDRCPGGLSIPLRGFIRETIVLTNPSDAKKIIESMQFGSYCLEVLSNPAYYVWRNSTKRKIFIDTIIVPEGFQHTRIRFPFVLEPDRGYQFNVVRFFPKRQGNFRDSIVFRCRLNGSPCTIERKIYVTGYGYEADVNFITQSANAGTCIVGQDKTFNVIVENKAPDAIRASFYFEKGEAFFDITPKSATIASGGTVTLTVTFRPYLDSLYTDKLCLFEQKCFSTSCIPLTGKGILETFKFDPPIMRTENVIGCGSAFDTLRVKNISNQMQIMQTVNLSSPSGRYTLISPKPLPTTIELAGNADTTFIFQYIPNDTTSDRTDPAFLRFISNSYEWSAPMLGTSANPRLYVTPLSVFGSVEVNDTKIDTITIENISSVPVRVDRMSVPNGFTIISQNKPWGTVLQPRDSISVVLEFAPTIEQNYTNSFTVSSDSICKTSRKGTLEAKGIMYKLQAPISIVNWGYVRPCDCITREIPLINESEVHEMRVTSLVFDSTNVPDGTPDFWSWTSSFSPSGTLPIIIPPDTRDTLRLVFCPRTPAEDKYVDCATWLKFTAEGAGWQSNYSTYLLGKRALLYKPQPTFVGFAPTRVDTLSTPRIVRVTIPPRTLNPNQEIITIDSITFEPEERVFSYQEIKKTPFPVTVAPGDTLSVRVDFKPRAPREYEARMRLHTSNPCLDIDTTVLVNGDAFAPAFGLNFAFDTALVVVDSFRAPSCDTVRVPVWSSRNIPANLVDIFLRIGHDTSELRYVGADSYYLTTVCNALFLPQILNSPGPNNGTSLLCKNFCAVDSTQPFMIAKFISKTGQRSSTSITVDSIKFDTEESIRFNIIAGNDKGHVTIDKADIAIRTLLVNFDSVRVLDCKDTTLTVVNTGDIPLIIDSLPHLPPTIRVMGSNPPSNIPIASGDSIIFTIRYCPQRSDSLSDIIQARTIDPCTIIDTVPSLGRGYAPDMSVAFGITPDFSITDTVYGSFNDTITVPIYVEKDIAATYLGTTYWMKSLSFITTLYHNPTALKYIGYSIPEADDISVTPDSITIQFRQIDTLAAGKLGELYFKVVVPDTVISSMSVRTYNFIADSLQFLDVLPVGTSAYCKVGGQCGITTLKFIGLQPSLQQNIPNPFHESSIITFTLQEKAPVFLTIFDTQGKIVKTILDGSKIYSSGTYNVEVISDELESGVYFYEIQSGIFRQTKMMMIAH